MVVLTVPQTTPAGSTTQFVATRARFNNASQFFLTSNPTGLGTLTMAAATGYACQLSTCLSYVGGPRCCPDPLKTSLVLTLSSGTITLTGGPSWAATEDRGGIRFRYASDGGAFTYRYCPLGNPGDPTCANTASYSDPSAFTIDYPIACPGAYLSTGTLTSPHDSGAWSLVESP